MGWKDHVKEYFRFSLRDRLAILILSGLVALVFWLPEWLPRKSKPVLTALDSAWVRDAGQDPAQPAKYRKEEDGRSYGYDRPEKPARPGGTLFYFDPNSLSPEGWARLGLREKTIGTIRNYLAKGGRFREPEDLSRIYGLFPDEYERIAPYIRISAVPDSFARKESGKKENTYTPPRYTVIDINTADTAAFISLPGIGPALARRILLFREKLGGFCKLEQVAETYGLPDSTFQRIRPYLKLGGTEIRKIPLNSGSLDILKAHPYIRYQLARAITAYREQHGPYKSLEDLKQVALVSQDIWDKITPYLSLQ